MNAGPAAEVRPGAVAVVGAADLASPTGRLGTTARALQVQAVNAALADAGLALADVDALFVAASAGLFPSIELADHLGIQPRYTDSTMAGGASYEVHVEHAAAALALGLCDVAVIVCGEAPMTAIASGKASAALDPGLVEEVLQWEYPYGTWMPVVSYALAARRHMAQYGTTSEQLAAITVASRQWAAMNETARLRDPVTVNDVVTSKMVADPLHKLDCCVFTDGAGAIVLTRADRARDLRQPPVFVLGAATAQTHAWSISQMPDLTVSPGAISGPAAFKRAGITPDDVDVLQTYDSFTITVLLALEDLGFCPKGSGGPFVADGRLGPGGARPTNTNGGGLSYTHPGMFGIFLLVEAVRQLRGQGGERQVPRSEVAVAHACAGHLSCTSTVVLAGSQP